MKEHGCLKLDRLYLPHKSQEPMGTGVECYGLNVKCLFKVPGRAYTLWSPTGGSVLESGDTSGR